MAQKSFSASAPGSIMLFGEHAVLRGKSALVAAVDKRITVTLQPRNDSEIHIHSNLGKYITSINHINVEKPFLFVLACFKRHRELMPTGFNLEITSTFSHTVGLGSSAAVVVATLACLMQWLLGLVERKELFYSARNLIQSVQGCGSGADVAASIFGHIIHYHMEPASFEIIQPLPKFSLVYCGYKMPTPEVIRIVSERVSSDKNYFDSVFERMHQCTLKAKEALKNENHSILGKLMLEHQKYQKELGTSDAMLESLIHLSLQEEGILGAKISGSGLGDCIVTLGEIHHLPAGELIEITLSKQGVICESC